MSHSRRHLLHRSIAAVFLGLCLVIGLGVSQPAQAHGLNSNLNQEIAVPMYIEPTANPADWAQLLASDPDSVSLIVANVLNGPEVAPNPGWAHVLQQAHKNGIKVLGYVDSGYLGIPIPDAKGGLLTRSGLTGAAAWIPQIEEDINAWYQLYGSSVDGIFFDQATNLCGPVATSNEYATSYTNLSRYVKSSHRGAVTVLNPGIAVPNCYQDAADTLVTFEGSIGDYTGHPTVPQTAYVPLSWDPVNPAKIWHIIYGVPGISELDKVVRLSKSRNAGYVYVTNLVPANPYNHLPAPDYWSAHQDDVAPRGTPGDTAPSAPALLRAMGSTESAATSVTLRWSRALPESNRLVAYDINEDGVKVHSVGADRTSFSVIGLSPSTTYRFSVVARDSANNVSEESPRIVVTTAASSSQGPGAPTALSTVATAFTTATLQWQPPISSDRPLAGYEVDQDGVAILQVPSTMTKVSVGGLVPGPSAFTFTVRALDATGHLSPSSNPTVARTVSLPGGAAITAPVVTANGPTVTYQADFALPFAFRRAFIATATAANRCWTTGNSAPICADFMLENGRFYKYAGTGVDFTWVSVASAPITLTGIDTYSWTLPAAALGTTGGATVLFNGQGYAPLSYANTTKSPPTSAVAERTTAQDSQSGAGSGASGAASGGGGTSP